MSRALERKKVIVLTMNYSIHKCQVIFKMLNSIIALKNNPLEPN